MSIDIGQNVYADREADGFHGPYTDANGRETNQCWSDAPPIGDLVTHAVNHCSWWQLAGLIIALAGVIVGVVGLIITSGGTVAAKIAAGLIGAGVATVGLVLSIIGTACGMQWRDYKLDCGSGKIPRDAPPKG